MTTFTRTMAALDLSEMDASILKYIQWVTSIFQTRQLYFTHIIPNFSAPKNIDVEFHHLFAPEYPIDEIIKDKIEEHLSDVFSSYAHGMDIKVEVVEGTIYKTLLHWTELKAIDLLVVGKKNKSENSGIAAAKVARNAQSSVWFVTENASTTLQHIFVPMDYSEYSLRALQAALHLQKQFENAKITCMSIVQIPPSIYGMSLSFENMIDSLQENVKATHQQFLKKHEIDEEGISLVVKTDSFSNVASLLRDYAKMHQADLIIMGARGHSTFENFIYGSVTERLVNAEDKIPVLVIR